MGTVLPLVPSAVAAPRALTDTSDLQRALRDRLPAARVAAIVDCNAWARSLLLRRAAELGLDSRADPLGAVATLLQREVQAPEPSADDVLGSLLDLLGPLAGAAAPSTRARVLAPLRARASIGALADYLIRLDRRADAPASA